MPTTIPTIVSPMVPPSNVPLWTTSAESDFDISTATPTIMATPTPMRKCMIIALTNAQLVPPDGVVPMRTTVALR